jgi:hypothetical protein
MELVHMFHADDLAGFPFSFGVLNEYYTNNAPFSSNPTGISAVGTTCSVSLLFSSLRAVLTHLGYYVPGSADRFRNISTVPDLPETKHLLRTPHRRTGHHTLIFRDQSLASYLDTGVTLCHRRRVVVLSYLHLH